MTPSARRLLGVILFVLAAALLPTTVDADLVNVTVYGRTADLVTSTLTFNSSFSVGSAYYNTSVPQATAFVLVKAEFASSTAKVVVVTNTGLAAGSQTLTTLTTSSAYALICLYHINIVTIISSTNGNYTFYISRTAGDVKNVVFTALDTAYVDGTWTWSVPFQSTSLSQFTGSIPYLYSSITLTPEYATVGSLQLGLSGSYVSVVSLTASDVYTLATGKTQFGVVSSVDGAYIFSITRKLADLASVSVDALDQFGNVITSAVTMSPAWTSSSPHGLFTASLTLKTTAIRVRATYATSTHSLQAAMNTNFTQAWSLVHYAGAVANGIAATTIASVTTDLTDGSTATKYLTGTNWPLLATTSAPIGLNFNVSFSQVNWLCLASALDGDVIFQLTSLPPDLTNITVSGLLLNTSLTATPVRTLTTGFLTTVKAYTLIFPYQVRRVSPNITFTTAGTVISSVPGTATVVSGALSRPLTLTRSLTTQVSHSITITSSIDGSYALTIISLPPDVTSIILAVDVASDDGLFTWSSSDYYFDGDQLFSLGVYNYTATVPCIDLIANVALTLIFTTASSVTLIDPTGTVLTDAADLISTFTNSFTVDFSASVDCQTFILSSTEDGDYYFTFCPMQPPADFFFIAAPNASMYSGVTYDNITLNIPQALKPQYVGGSLVLTLTEGSGYFSPSVITLTGTDFETAINVSFTAGANAEHINWGVSALSNMQQSAWTYSVTGIVRGNVTALGFETILYAEQTVAVGFSMLGAPILGDVTVTWTVDRGSMTPSYIVVTAAGVADAHDSVLVAPTSAATTSMSLAWSITGSNYDLYDLPASTVTSVLPMASLSLDFLSVLSTTQANSTSADLSLVMPSVPALGSDVYVEFSVTNGTFTPSWFVFSSTNWSTAQTVTYTSPDVSVSGVVLTITIYGPGQEAYVRSPAPTFTFDVVEATWAPSLKVVGVTSLLRTILNAYDTLLTAGTSDVPSSATYAYAWTLQRWNATTSAYDTITLDATVPVNQHQLQIPPYSLVALQHRLSCVVTIAVNSTGESITLTSALLIQVASGQLLATIYGGDRQRPVDQVLHIDGSLSEDLDLASSYHETESGSPLLYAWSCSPLSGNTSCVVPADQANQSTLALDGGTLTRNVAYLFTLAITSSTSGDTRTNSTSITVTGSNATISAVNATQVLGPLVIIAGAPSSVSLSNPLRLVSTIVRNGTMVVDSLAKSWSVVPHLDLTSSSVISASSDASTLVVREGVLQANVSYLFTFVVEDLTTRLSNTAKVEVIVNAPPANGTCTITPVSGAALSDHFAAKCSGWIAGTSNPLYYALAYVDADGASITLTLPSTSSTVFAKLPAGTWDLVALITSTDGSIATTDATTVTSVASTSTSTRRRLLATTDSCAVAAATISDTGLSIATTLADILYWSQQVGVSLTASSCTSGLDLQKLWMREILNATATTYTTVGNDTTAQVLPCTLGLSRSIAQSMVALFGGDNVLLAQLDDEVVGLINNLTVVASAYLDGEPSYTIVNLVATEIGGVLSKILPLCTSFSATLAATHTLFTALAARTVGHESTVLETSSFTLSLARSVANEALNVSVGGISLSLVAEAWLATIANRSTLTNETIDLSSSALNAWVDTEVTHFNSTAVTCAGADTISLTLLFSDLLIAAIDLSAYPVHITIPPVSASLIPACHLNPVCALFNGTGYDTSVCVTESVNSLGGLECSCTSVGQIVAYYETIVCPVSAGNSDRWWYIIYLAAFALLGLGSIVTKLVLPQANQLSTAMYVSLALLAAARCFEMVVYWRTDSYGDQMRALAKTLPFLLYPWVFGCLAISFSNRFARGFLAGADLKHAFKFTPLLIVSAAASSAVVAALIILSCLLDGTARDTCLIVCCALACVFALAFAVQHGIASGGFKLEYRLPKLLPSGIQSTGRQVSLLVLLTSFCSFGLAVLLILSLIFEPLFHTGVEPLHLAYLAFDFVSWTSVLIASIILFRPRSGANYKVQEVAMAEKADGDKGSDSESELSLSSRHHRKATVVPEVTPRLTPGLDAMEWVIHDESVPLGPNDQVIQVEQFTTFGQPFVPAVFKPFVRRAYDWTKFDPATMDPPGAYDEVKEIDSRQYIRRAREWTLLDTAAGEEAPDGVEVRQVEQLDKTGQPFALGVFATFMKTAPMPPSSPSESSSALPGSVPDSSATTIAPRVRGLVLPSIISPTKNRLPPVGPLMAGSDHAPATAAQNKTELFSMYHTPMRPAKRASRSSISGDVVAQLQHDDGDNEDSESDAEELQAAASPSMASPPPTFHPSPFLSPAATALPMSPSGVVLGGPMAMSMLASEGEDLPPPTAPASLIPSSTSPRLGAMNASAAQSRWHNRAASSLKTQHLRMSSQAKSRHSISELDDGSLLPGSSIQDELLANAAAAAISENQDEMQPMATDVQAEEAAPAPLQEEPLPGAIEEPEAEPEAEAKAQA